jgi:DNA-binding CsgD family transcriptional regulator
MTETASNRQKAQTFDWRLPIAPNEKGVIVATKESRVVEWVNDFIRQCMGNQCVLRHAPTNKNLSYLAGNQKMAAAFIETCFYGDAAIACLERLHRQYPKLRIVLFTVSDIAMDEVARYLFWSGGGFISLRDSPETIQEQLNNIFLEANKFSEDLLQNIRDYELLPMTWPGLTHREIEILRYIMQEKTLKETARCLKISDSTVYNHLDNIRRKFGIRNMVGILKLAVAQGILPEKELRMRCVKFRV